MESQVAAMVSFGNLGGLRSFQLCEIQAGDLLGDIVSQFGPDGWCSDPSCISVKISTTKSGGFDKFLAKYDSSNKIQIPGYLVDLFSNWDRPRKGYQQR